MVQRLAKIGSAVALLLFGVVLLHDATTFSFYAPNPITGDPGGCVLIIELLLGRSGPEWLRAGEFIAGVLLLGVVPTGAARSAWHRGRRA